jgi:hypothetical protein
MVIVAVGDSVVDDLDCYLRRGGGEGRRQPSRVTLPTVGVYDASPSGLLQSENLRLGESSFSLLPLVFTQLIACRFRRNGVSEQGYSGRRIS